MANNWIHQQEAAHLKKIAEEMEYALFFGESGVKRRDLKIQVARLYEEKRITREDMDSLVKIIDSPAGDDLQFAETLIETIKNNGSNISLKESQIPELRPQ